MAITIEALDAPIGCRVLGLDGGTPISEVDYAAVRQAMIVHRAIVIDDLPEEPAWLLDFGQRFGPLLPHMYSQYHHPVSSGISIIAANTGTAESRPTAKPAGAFWHSDLSYTATPSDAIFLYASLIPSQGGDTLLCDLTAAYAALPEGTKQRIDGLTAKHYYQWNTGGATLQLSPEMEAKYPIVSHPMVRRHPESGARSLFVNPGYTMAVEGLPEDESRDLLQELFDHCLQPQFCHRHRWTKGQLVGLDNRATMHSAVADYSEPRRMLRMIVGCTDPAFAAAA